MVAKRESRYEQEDFEFYLDHADVVELMNEAPVLIDGGNVETTQELQIIIQKENGRRIVLRQLNPTDTIVFKFSKVTESGIDQVFTDMDVT